MRTKEENRERRQKALELYNNTRDILAVKQFLGHKSIHTTLRHLAVEKT